MNTGLNHYSALLIVRRMKRALLLIAFTSMAAAPVMAQTTPATSAFGLVIGGAQQLHGGVDFKFSSSVLEGFYETTLEPDMMLRFKVGQIEAPVTLRDDSTAIPTNISGNGKIEHADILVDYRFSEVFGSTGLFAGPGYYRQRLNGQTESNYGLCAGVNGAFPMTRRYALVLEATYHWINFHDRGRYLTATGGVKINF
jgi:hypothetical protein